MENEETENNGLGRPTKFNDHVQSKIQRLAALGLTNKQLAAALDITETTLYNWQNKYKDFFESLTRSKRTANRVVEASLYQAALGYSVPEDKIFVHEGKAVIVPTIKNYPPDTKAIALWLKNREPKKWRDKVEVEHDGELTIKWQS